MVVEKGKRYLLRIVNAILNEEMFFGITNHSLQVVGTDGAYIKPITVDYIVITPGQTMDVLLTANQEESTYYIAASPFADTVVSFDNTTTTAILKYEGNYTLPSSNTLPTFPAYNDSEAAAIFTNKIRALGSVDHPVDVPAKITKRIIMTVSVNTLPCPNSSCSGANGDRQSASLNNISFFTPSVDILKAYYGKISGVFSPDFPMVPPTIFDFTGDVDNITLYTSQGTKALLICYGESLEIVFQGTNLLAAENHPMHLHGYSFYLVGKDRGNFNVDTDPLKYNLIDPPEVNTIGVPRNGWAAIRFIANNPGVWFIHCHLERHTSWGMDTVLIVMDGDTNTTSIRPPPPYMPPCSSS